MNASTIKHTLVEVWGFLSSSVTECLIRPHRMLRINGYLEVILQ